MELSIPEVRSHGGAERALDRQVRGFGHPALRVPSVPNQRVVTDYFRCRSLAEDERIDIERIELEGVIPAVERPVGDDRQQVVCRNADNLRSGLHIVFLVDRTLDIKHSKQLRIGDCGNLQLLYVTIRPVEVVLRSVAPSKNILIECDVAGLWALLRVLAEQRPPDPHFEPIKRFALG